MPETRRIPYLPTETPIEIPTDLPVPSTTRVLQPRSRATSLARSEARSASGSRRGSRPGSRAGSPRSRASSSSRSRMAEPIITADEGVIRLGVPSTVETGMDLVEAADDAGEQGPSIISVQTDVGGNSVDESGSFDQGLPSASFFSMEHSWATTSELSNWQFASDGSPSLPQILGSASHGKRKHEGSEPPSIPHSVEVDVESSIPLSETSTWQTDGLKDEFSIPIRLGLDYGGPSGSGVGFDGSSSKRKRSPASSSPEEPLSQRSWRTDFDAEIEVADQLLFDDASDVPLSQLSTASSTRVSEKSKKGKGKARAKTPDPASVIVIPDTPPTTHKEVLPPPPPPPEPLSSYTCPICFSQPTNATLTPCGHICCGACLFAAVKTTLQRAALVHVGPALNEARCPVCRATIPGWDGKGGGVIGLKARAIFRL